METMTDLIFLGSKTTADGDCRHEIKRYSLEESYDKPRQCIKKQRHHFANKGPYGQSYGFSSSHVRAGPKRWLSIEELRVPWTARKSNQSILKETNPECLLDGLMLKRKLQYFGHLICRAASLEKTLMLGKIEGRRRDRQRIRWVDGIIDSMDMSLSKLWKMVKEREDWYAAVHGVTKSWMQLNNSMF